MRKALQHFVVLLCVTVTVFSSCADEEKVIPRGKLARIYAEMLMTDQWINATPGVRMIADTSLVYEPILESYGYSTEDYMRTVDVYMDDPERFSRILRQTSDILDKRMKELRKIQGEIEVARLAAIIKTDFRAEDLFPYLGDEPYVHYYDSISFVPDSATLMYRLVPVERADTIYDQLRMVIRADSLAADSLETQLIKEEAIGDVAAGKEKAEVGKPSGLKHPRPSGVKAPVRPSKDAPDGSGIRRQLPEAPVKEAVTKLEVE